MPSKKLNREVAIFPKEEHIILLQLAKGLGVAKSRVIRLAVSEKWQKYVGENSQSS
jgi:hypothetical protein